MRMNPDHYCEGRNYEPKDVIRDWDLNFNLGNVVKYISRAGRKDNALDDLRKAKTYLEFEIEHLENKTIKSWMGEPDPNVTYASDKNILSDIRSGKGLRPINTNCGECPRDPD